jgi:hypothetical protein
MSDLQTIMMHTFGKKKEETQKPETLKPPEIPKPPKPIGKTVGDPRIAAEAQRIYNPSKPPVPSKPPSSDMLGQGSAPAMDISGSWGKPNG